MAEPSTQDAARGRAQSDFAANRLPNANSRNWDTPIREAYDAESARLRQQGNKSN